MSNRLYQFNRRKNGATIVYFPLVDRGTLDILAGLAFVAADTKISIDGGAFANTNSVPVAGPGNGFYSLTLTAAEMNGDTLNLLIVDAATKAWEDQALQITTFLELSKINVVADASGTHAVSFIGFGAGHGMNLKGGNTGRGLYAAGGAISGEGIKAECVAGDSAGLFCVGLGAGPGIQGTGGVTGNGIVGLGGATSGNGLLVQAAGGGGSGILSIGATTGHGLTAFGGASGHGIYAFGGSTTGSGIKAEAQAGSAGGLFCVGAGTGPGIQGTGGLTGDGIVGLGGVTSGHGMRVQALGSNFSGISAVAHGSGIHIGGVWNVTEAMLGGEPTTPQPDNSNMGLILQHSKRRFHNKIAQTEAFQTVYRDDSTAVLESGTVSDDGITQAKGKFT